MTGTNGEGKPVFLRDIWPSRDDIQKVERKHVIPAMFQEVYSRIQVCVAYITLLCNSVYHLDYTATLSMTTPTVSNVFFRGIILDGFLSPNIGIF